MLNSVGVKCGPNFVKYSFLHFKIVHVGGEGVEN